MILFPLVRKILVSLAPLAFFYLLRKISGKQHLPKRKSHLSGFDNATRYKKRRDAIASDYKSRIVEGEIVEEKNG